MFRRAVVSSSAAGIGGTLAIPRGAGVPPPWGLLRRSRHEVARMGVIAAATAKLTIVTKQEMDGQVTESTQVWTV